jgi:hypothetical protein
MNSTPHRPRPARLGAGLSAGVSAAMSPAGAESRRMPERFLTDDVIGKGHGGRAACRNRAGGVTRGRVTKQFLQVCLDGDVSALLNLLAPDVTLRSDSGGKARAPLRPIHGRDKVARFLIAVAAEAQPPGSEVRIVELNGGPAAVLLGPTGPTSVAVLDLGLDDHRITDIHLVANPDKLRGLSAQPAATTC